MFEVRTNFPFDDDWELKSDVAREAAGVKSSFSGAGFGVRDIGWEIPTFEEAQIVRQRLVAAGFHSTTIRET